MLGSWLYSVSVDVSCSSMSVNVMVVSYVFMVGSDENSGVMMWLFVGWWICL